MKELLADWAFGGRLELLIWSAGASTMLGAGLFWFSDTTTQTVVGIAIHLAGLAASMLGFVLFRANQEAWKRVLLRERARG